MGTIEGHSGNRVTEAGAQGQRDTKAQMYIGTEVAQMHQGTEAQRQVGAQTQMHGGKGAMRHRGTLAHGRGNAEAQGHEGTEAQRHSCTEAQDRRTGHTQRHGTEVRCTRCQATEANHDTHPTRALGTGYMAADPNPGTSKLLSTTVGTLFR